MLQNDNIVKQFAQSYYLVVFILYESIVYELALIHWYNVASLMMVEMLCKKRRIFLTSYVSDELRVSMHIRSFDVGKCPALFICTFYI